MEENKVYYDVKVFKTVELDSRYPSHFQTDAINRFRDEFVNTLQERLDVYLAEVALAEARDILENKKREYE